VAGPGAETLGLIAGGGSLPLALARAARRAGRRVAAVAFPGRTDPALAGEVASLAWHRPGEVGAVTRSLGAAGAARAVMAGKLPKAALTGDPDALGLDAEARRLLAGLRDRGDASILRALADHLESRGIRLLPQAELVPEWVAAEGPLGRVALSAEQRRDVDYGLPIARELARLDVGQTVVVAGRAVLAVEAIEGTDEAIARAGRFATGASVVKVARPGQDARFDNPAIGPDTIAALVRAGAGALAVEAGVALLIERDETLAAADAAGIALLGVRP